MMGKSQPIAVLPPIFTFIKMDAITSSSQESDTDTSARFCDYAANLHTINI